MTDTHLAPRRTPTPAFSWAIRGILRAEGGFLAVAAGFGYHLTGGSWWLFAALFLIPDLAILGYLFRPRIGAAVYNAMHSYVAPITLAGLGLAIESDMTLPLALIWTAHIGADRAFGYGLKLPDGFDHTHLDPRHV